MKVRTLFFIKNIFSMCERFKPGLPDLPFPMDAFHDAAHFPEMRRKECDDERAGAERRGFKNERFGFMNAHGTLNAFLFDAFEDLTLFTVHGLRSFPVLILIAHQMQNAMA